MLSKEEYLGHTINFKTRKHYKDKKSHYVSKDQWLIFENTHEPIIDEETFQNVQRIRRNVKRYPDGWGEYHPLTSLMYCKDCGSKLYVHRTSNFKSIPYYVCSGYTKSTRMRSCKTAHRILAENVIDLIKEILKEIQEQVKVDKAQFITSLRDDLEEKVLIEQERLSKRKDEVENRLEELEKLICRIYEDMIIDKIPASRYETLNRQYESEQLKLKEELGILLERIKEKSVAQKSPQKFINLIEKYESFEKLDTYMINEFVEKIVVHERDFKNMIDSPQTVEIYFNFVGKYDLKEKVLSEEEQKEIEKKMRRKERAHRNYLRRKANGKIKEWEEKYKARRKELTQEKISKLPQSGIRVADCPILEPCKGKIKKG
jgi:tnpX site-specific recombinase